MSCSGPTGNNCTYRHVEQSSCVGEMSTHCPDVMCGDCAACGLLRSYAYLRVWWQGRRWLVWSQASFARSGGTPEGNPSPQPQGFPSGFPPHPLPDTPPGPPEGPLRGPPTPMAEARAPRQTETVADTGQWLTWNSGWHRPKPSAVAGPARTFGGSWPGGPETQHARYTRGIADADVSRWRYANCGEASRVAPPALSAGVLSHERAVPAGAHHQPFALEDPQCLDDRGRGHAMLLRKLHDGRQP